VPLQGSGSWARLHAFHRHSLGCHCTSSEKRGRRKAQKRAKLENMRSVNLCSGPCHPTSDVL